MSFVSFGEIMLRLVPEKAGIKLASANSFQAGFAGSESNVASSLAILGNPSAFITKLPSNPLGNGAIASLNSFGIDTSRIIRGGNRLGTYFIELGSSIRPSQVVYDRRESAISEIGEGEFNWEQVFQGKRWLFLSGITPALSDQCARETVKAARIARNLGVKVAFDMNYRRTLWEDSSVARQRFGRILEHTDILFGNIGALSDVYGFQSKASSALDQTVEAAEFSVSNFGIDHMAFTVREHPSATVNTVYALYRARSAVETSDPIEVVITDRFGAGDAFAAAFLHAMNKGWSSKETVDFAAAAFALKHTIAGDQHTSSEAEINAVRKGLTKGHVIR